MDSDTMMRRVAMAFGPLVFAGALFLGSAGGSPPKNRFKEGTIQEACAPNDAASMLILLTDGKGSYPVLMLNWWGPGKPDLKGGSFSISGQGPAMESGFQASFCLMRGECRPLKNATFKLNWKDSGRSGILNFSVETSDGEVFSGQVPLKYQKPKARVLCG